MPLPQRVETEIGILNWIQNSKVALTVAELTPIALSLSL